MESIHEKILFVLSQAKSKKNCNWLPREFHTVRNVRIFIKWKLIFLKFVPKLSSVIAANVRRCSKFWISIKISSLELNSLWQTWWNSFASLCLCQWNRSSVGRFQLRNDAFAWRWLCFRHHHQRVSRSKAESMKRARPLPDNLRDSRFDRRVNWRFY